MLFAKVVLIIALWLLMFGFIGAAIDGKTVMPSCLPGTMVCF